MSILVDKNTKLVVQGITGREGAFHATRNKAYGTNVVAGVTPGKAGQDVDGIPVFNTVRDAVEETGANTAMVFVPPRFATDALYEAIESGVELIICITEGIPAHDMLRVYTHLRRGNQTLIGPNCPGVISPGQASVGIMPTQVFNPGRVGLHDALRHADISDLQDSRSWDAPEHRRRHRRRRGGGLVVHRRRGPLRQGPRHRPDRHGRGDRRQ